MPRRKPRLVEPKHRRKRQPVELTRVSPMVHALALAAAEGDPSRLTILDENTVLIDRPVKLNGP